MLKSKKNYSKEKWLKSEISFSLKDILIGVIREIAYMSILVVILLGMTMIL